MLDMILSILSVLGIILLVVLGIVLAILLIVLFFPITYKAEGVKDVESFWIKAKANWLFWLIRVRFYYPEPGNAVVKVLWFTVFDSKAPKPPKKASSVSGGTEDGKADRKEASTADKKEESSASTSENRNTENDQGALPGTVADFGVNVAGVESTVSEEPSSISQDTAAGQEAGEKTGFLRKIALKIEKIKFKILNIYDKIKHIWENIKFYKDLLQEEQTKELLRHLGLRLKKIIWSIRPRKIKADIVFGASSPDITGYCMAVYGILSPCLGKRVRFVPDFEQEIFRGEFSLAGHITLFPLLLHAGIFALDKKLKLLIRKIKAFRNKESGSRIAA